MLNDDHFVSVIMPVKDAGRFLRESIESILCQTFTNFELLITDDGSTDRSSAILRRYSAQDRRIRMIARIGTGLLVALNEMLVQSRGEFVARMDADDIAMPDRLERQVAYLKANPGDLVVGSRVLVVDPDGDPLCEWNPEQSHEEIDAIHLEGTRGAVICHPAAMMRRAAVLAIGGYRQQYDPAEDLDLFLRLAERGRVANLSSVLLKYRMHPTSVCHTRQDEQRRAIRAAIVGARERRGLPPVEVPTPEKAPAPTGLGLRITWAWWALAAGHVSTARKHALAVLVKSPLSLDSWRLFYCAARGY